MRRQRGFTLPELVVVIVVGGIIAATVTVFLRPAVDSWLAVRVRGDLNEQAATALAVMRRDVRLAVPNSIRAPNDKCFELVPTSAGGRFRTAPDTTAPGTSAPLDLTDPNSTTFDVLTPLAATPAAGDWAVIDNQNPGDVYDAGAGNRVAITGFDTTVPAAIGRARITLAGAFARPGYDGARFVVVPERQQAVFYVCSGADGTKDAQGHGKGTLTRYSHYGFNAAYPGGCAAPAGATAAVLATRVLACSFVYDPNKGATQQSGFVSMRLDLARSNETVGLLAGAHVVNVP